MGVLKRPIAISREDLTRACMQELHLWPGCETVEGLGCLGIWAESLRFMWSTMAWQINTSRTGPFDASNGRSCGNIVWKWN